MCPSPPLDASVPTARAKRYDLVAGCYPANATITRKAGKRLFLLLQLKRSGIPVEDLLTVYTTVVRPTLEYACPAWSTSLTLGLQSDMEREQRRAMNIIYPNTTYTEALANAQLTSLKQTRAQLCEHFFT